MILTEETKKSILELQKLYPQKRSALIPALHIVQAQIGFLPTEAQSEVADLFQISTNEVNSIVTFYDMFFEKPVGKHLLHVCKNVSCMLMGSDSLIEKLCQHLNVATREITKDGEFSIIPSECLGACDRAPMMLVDDKVVGPINEDQIERILADAKNGKGHPSPIDIREVSHA